MASRISYSSTKLSTETPDTTVRLPAVSSTKQSATSRSMAARMGVRLMESCSLSSSSRRG